jgi:hypothetical protein
MADVLGDAELVDDGYGDDDWEPGAGREPLLTADVLALSSLVIAVLAFLAQAPGQVVVNAWTYFSSGGLKSLRHAQMAVAATQAVVAMLAVGAGWAARGRDELRDPLKPVAGAGVVLGLLGAVIWLAVLLFVGLHHTRPLPFNFSG